MTEFLVPDMAQLSAISAEANPATLAEAEAMLHRDIPELSLEELAMLLAAILAEPDGPVAACVQNKAMRLRKMLFGNQLVPMAPVEISNACASDCVFCGWRSSNRLMKRLRIPPDLVMLQVEYLIDMGIHYIEFVSGDDIRVVRNVFPELISATRELFDKRGINGKISVCTLALTEKQYQRLRVLGADSMIVWQETYDPQIFNQHIRSGPKARGITEDWRIPPDGDGCRFRIESQERALRAGLEVSIGSMLGLNPDVVAEFLAVVEHARSLNSRYDFTAQHPLIIGMPIWNSITTIETDQRPSRTYSTEELFPSIAALYLLAMPTESTWVFPNCRVSMPTQIRAAQVAGVFSSTEVKLGPGGYLPSVLRMQEARGSKTAPLRRRIAQLLREGGEDIDELAIALDEREQFIHHYHAHEVYRRQMQKAGLRLVTENCLDNDRESAVA